MTFKVVIEEGGKYTTLELRKVRSRGVKPYRDPLPYSSYVWDEKRALAKYYSYYGKTQVGTLMTAQIGTLKEQFYVGYGVNTLKKNEVWNKALTKVDDQLNYITNLFEAWYERREAYSMLGTCLRGILTFAKNFRNPRYLKKLRDAAGKTAKRPETLPEAWLLWNFALKPLVGTIEDIFSLLSKPMPIVWVEGASGYSTEGTYDNRTSQKEGVFVKYKTDYIVKHGLRVTGLNPNAALLNSMGMTTPFSTAMSVVPWGWAVNYFVNVSELLNNFEVRWPGVNIDTGYSTTFVKTKYDGHYGMLTASGIDVWLPNNGFDKYKNPVEYLDYDGEITSMTRTVGIPKYKLNISYPALGTNQFANLASAIALIFASQKPKK